MNLKFILFIPLIEIILFVLCGDFLGFLLVIFLIILTGSFGLILLRSSININDIKELASEPNEWVYKKIAGLLLIIPGFFTDLLGLILLMKHLRSMVWNLLVSKKKVHKKKTNDARDIIDVEYRDLDDKWTYDIHGKSIELQGWVINSEDKSVSMKISGKKKNVKMFLIECYKGPIFSKVLDVKAKEIIFKPFKDFQIRY